MLCLQGWLVVRGAGGMPWGRPWRAALGCLSGSRGSSRSERRPQDARAVLQLCWQVHGLPSSKILAKNDSSIAVARCKETPSSDAANRSIGSSCRL